MRGRVGLKSVNPSPPRPASRCGSKISPHPCPTTFTGRGKPARGEAGWGGSSRAGQNCHPQIARINIEVLLQNAFLWGNMVKIILLLCRILCKAVATCQCPYITFCKISSKKKKKKKIVRNKLSPLLQFSIKLMENICGKKLNHINTTNNL